MSCENTNARLQIKYSTIAGQVPTIPSTNDHNDGTWNPTDIYVGEFFLNATDDKLWVRTIDGLLPMGGTGGTGSFIGDFVSKAHGGTYSGPVWAPTFSSTSMVATTISATSVNANIFGSSGSTYYGDGSHLTGVTTVWNGGTVSNPSEFNNTVDFNQDISVNNVYAGTLGYTHIHSDVTVDGGLSASYFVGDGSLLTNLPIGPTANYYTTNSYLDGNTIRFDRTDLSDAYSVDLTPILFTQSVAGFDWNSSLNEATIFINDGSFFTINLNVFSDISAGIINATDVYASNFYGTFNGVFTDDIYTTSATLDGTEAVFTRTDGVTYSLDLSTFSGGGGATGPAGATGATGANGLRSIMNLSYTGSGLTLGLGTKTLPIGTPINNLGWQQGTRVRIWNDATHYMEGQITSTIANPQTTGINVNVDYVVGTGSFGAWYVGIAGDLGSGGSGGSQTLEDTLVLGNQTGANDIIVNTGYGIKHDTDNTLMVEYGNDGTFDYVSVGDTTSSTFKVRKDNDWRIDQTLGSVTTSVFSNVGDGSVDILSTDGTTSASISVQSVGDINMLGSNQIYYSLTDPSSNFSAVGTIAKDTTSLGNDYISPNPGFPDFHRRGSVNTKSGAAMGDETWGELRSENVNGTSYAYIRSTDLGGAYPANIMEVGDVGTDWTTIEHNFNEIKITSTNTGFYGVQYDQDWSANYTNRSLVDKEYVDTHISSGATGLGGVLSISNSTGANDILASNGYGIANYDGVQKSKGLGFDSDSVFLYSGTGSIEDYSPNGMLSMDSAGAINVQTVDSLYVNMNLYGSGTGVFNVNGHSSFAGIQYQNNYSANYTSRSLVDKGYVDGAAISAAGGTAAATMFASVVSPAAFGGLPWYKLNTPAISFSTANYTLSQNVINYSMISLVPGEVINEIAIYCSTALAAATASIALYSVSLDANGYHYPSTLLTTFGDLSLATTGRKTITGLNYTIPFSKNGIYYTAILRTGAAGSPTITGPANTTSNVYYGSLNATTMDRPMTARPSVAFTSFPTTITSASYSAYVSSTTLPYIGFR